MTRAIIALAMWYVLGGWIPAFAQTVGTGRITGVITDSAGSALPGVTVTVIGQGFKADSARHLFEMIKERSAEAGANKVRLLLVDRERVEAGAEYIAFAAWEPAAKAYRVQMVIPVRSGWVEAESLTDLGLPAGSPVNDVLEQLRSHAGSQH